MSSRGVVLEEFQQPLVVREFDVPDPGPGAAVVRVGYGGVCGTDLHLQQGRLPVPRPVVLGHEAVGQVAALGEGVTADVLGAPLTEGDWVVWASSIPCGRCRYCLVEQARTLCAQRRIYGINQRCDQWPHLSGGWADAIYLQPGTTIVRLPDGVAPLDAIALGCAGPTVVHGLEHTAGVGLADVVVVQGSGPVGLAAAMYAKLAGAARVVIVGGPGGRLQLARELGIGDAHIDIFTTPDAAERQRLVRAEPGAGDGADLVIECTGVPAAVAEGIDLCRPNGEYLVLGQYTDHGPTPVNPHLITRKQLRVNGSWAFAEAHYIGYARSLPRLLERFALARMVSLYPLEAANDALEEVRSGRAVKAVLRTAHA